MKDNLSVSTHTEVFPEFKGMGIGKVLLEKAVEYAREEIVKIIPIMLFRTISIFQK